MHDSRREIRPHTSSRARIACGKGGIDLVHYLFTARSVTHAQKMAQALAGAGIGATMRRVGSGVTGTGCGYTLQVGEAKLHRAYDALRESGVRPVKVLRVSDGEMREVLP